MRRTKFSAILVIAFLLPCLSLAAKSAPAPDETASAKTKLNALKVKLPSMLKECLGDEKVWPVKFKGKISSLRLIAPNEAKLTIRLEYIPPETPDTPAPAGVGGGRGPGGGPRSLQTANQVIFINLRFFD